MTATGIDQSVSVSNGHEQTLAMTLLAIYGFVPCIAEWGRERRNLSVWYQMLLQRPEKQCQCDNCPVLDSYEEQGMRRRLPHRLAGFFVNQD
jgi:hypothetical protein